MRVHYYIDTQYSLYDLNEILVNDIMESLDQHSRRSISKKLASGRRSKALSGEKGAGNVSIGYKWRHDNTKKPIVVVDDEKAVIVKEIFTKYYGLKQLVR